MDRVVLLAALLAFAAYGQTRDQVAIINTVDDGNPPIALLELIHLTDRLREVAVGILPKSKYSVMTTESIVALFESAEDAAKACNESNCLVELGRKITADYVAQGRIGRFGENLTIKVELYHSMSGSLVASFTGNSKDIYGLLSVLDAKAPDMFKKMLSSLSGGSSSTPSVVGGIGSVETTAGGILADGERRYIVNLNTDPRGAVLSFNGDAIPSCREAPCRVELPEGDVRVVANLEQYERADTMVSIKQNNQSVNIKLKANFGVLEVKPAYYENVGGNRGWGLTINGKAASSMANKLSPGNYEVKLRHECYEDISFKVGINKGSHEVFDIAKYLNVKMGVLDLSAEKNGEPVSEPVFVNGKQVGETPFSKSAPVCSEIMVGKEKVDVRLKYGENVRHTHRIKTEAKPQVEPQKKQPQYASKQTRKEKGIERSLINIGIGGSIKAYLAPDKIYKGEVYEDGDATSKATISPSIGLIAGISFTDWMALYSEYYYAYRVFKNTKCSQNCTRIVEHALDIPLLIKFNLEETYTSYYIEAGVLYGIPLSTKIRSPSTLIEREKRDFGCIFGGGINGRHKIDLGLRFVVNTSDFAKNIEGSFWSFGGIVRIGRL
jgi:hypothetical protein